MEQIIIELISKYGYAGIFGLITLENIFPPIPSEVILTAGGFMTTCTSMTILGVTMFSTFGSLLGAIILYYLGRFLSPEKIILLAQSRLGRILHFQAADLLKTIEKFKTKGSKSVFFCRFVPILRSLISIPAGMCHMDPLLFLLYTIAGSFGWNLILIFLGSILGNHREYFLTLYSKYSAVIRLILLLYIIVWLYRTIKRRKRVR